MTVQARLSFAGAAVCLFLVAGLAIAGVEALYLLPLLAVAVALAEIGKRRNR